jgi:urease accessory protein
VHDLADLEAFTTGRLATSGPLEAWLAIAACRAVTADATSVAVAAPGNGAPGGGAAGISIASSTTANSAADIERLDEIADASTPVPALRATSRALGRGLRRSATDIWPALAEYGGEHHPVVVGVLAGVLGLGPATAGSLAVHSLVTGVVVAAPKLLAIDTVDALAIAVRLAPLGEAIVAEALTSAAPPIRSAPLHEARAHRHAHQEMRLYAS